MTIFSALPKNILNGFRINYLSARPGKEMLSIRPFTILAAIILLTSCNEQAPNCILYSRALNDNWQFAKAGDTLTYAAKVPGSIHTDLLANNLIEDPFYRNNELKLHWIENESWEYFTTINISKELNLRQRIILRFEGLDTYTEIKLNDELILETNNMFRTWEVDIKKQLKSGANKLTIRFLSPIAVNKAKLDALPYQLPAGCEKTEIKVSPFTRKAAYHFGWDWCPRFVTCGIWRPVQLIAYDQCRIKDVQVNIEEIRDSMAIVEYDIQTDGHTNDLNIRLNNKVMPFNKLVRDTIFNPKRWWPNGLGEQSIYTSSIELLKDGMVIDTKDVSFGLRTIELVSEPDSIGTSFYFEINGKPIFMKGANYIPQDMFLPRVTDAQYRNLLVSAQEAGMNMIRVWGGGIYENDIFYDLCDSLGLLVWQDFMFAGSMYPGDREFIENVKKEAIENVKRLNNHPCMALWCGNNEIEVAWQHWGWQKQYGYSPDDSTKIWSDYLHLFKEVLPEVVAGTDVPYVSTSPFSNWGTPDNFNHSSMHYWGVWHGKNDFESFGKNTGRFMVEYGFQSYPDMETILSFADSRDLSLSSEVMANRQKSYIGNVEIIKMNEKYFNKSSNFSEFLHLSQKVQSLALEKAISSHLNSDGHCMGTLLWQLNDCWPGPSWSIIDYFGKKKLGYFTVKDLFLEKQ
ncbi:MAG TPA: glycoside hydrolase family 2 protein [Flavobacteriales bacterium]|nr:glycoside hydrolase family 2 protein [Flavobacteriales bacterium]